MKRGFQPGDPRASAAGRKGGQFSGETRRQLRLARWARMFPEVDPVIVDRVYLFGFNARAGSKKKVA